MNDNATIDAVTACRRYRDSMTPMMLVRFERNLLTTFGAIPEHAIPAKEARLIYEQTLTECCDNVVSQV